jgi:hypothetical protein
MEELILKLIIQLLIGAIIIGFALLISRIKDK